MVADSEWYLWLVTSLMFYHDLYNFVHFDLFWLSSFIFFKYKKQKKKTKKLLKKAYKAVFNLLPRIWKNIVDGIS